MDSDTTVLITLDSGAALEITKHGDLRITQGDFETVWLGKATVTNIESIMKCFEHMKVHAT